MPQPAASCRRGRKSLVRGSRDDLGSVRRVILVVAATQRELDGAATAETLACGVGPVEAAVTTARALAERRPDAVLHVGIAGARGLATTSTVIGSEAVYEDPVGPLVPTRVEPDATLLAAARRALPDAHVLPIGTSAHVGGTRDCDVEAMEGFAVLRAAELAGVPAIEVRVVSNDVDEPDRARWELDGALAMLADVLPRLLGELAR
jgi:futalosine hydrolase